jgi:hypothetical protein
LLVGDAPLVQIRLRDAAQRRQRLRAVDVPLRDVARDLRARDLAAQLRQAVGLGDCCTTPEIGDLTTMLRSGSTTPVSSTVTRTSPRSTTPTL